MSVWIVKTIFVLFDRADHFHSSPIEFDGGSFLNMVLYYKNFRLCRCILIVNELYSLFSALRLDISACSRQISVWILDQLLPIWNYRWLASVELLLVNHTLSGHYRSLMRLWTLVWWQIMQLFLSPLNFFGYAIYLSVKILYLNFLRNRNIIFKC